MRSMSMRIVLFGPALSFGAQTPAQDPAASGYGRGRDEIVRHVDELIEELARSASP
jgi:hypothetical protein